MTTKMITTTCPLCSREVEPCANCGGTDGFMVQVHGHWIHKHQVDCIVHLQREIKAAEGRIAELDLELEAQASAE